MLIKNDAFLKIMKTIILHFSFKKIILHFHCLKKIANNCSIEESIISFVKKGKITHFRKYVLILSC